VLRRKRLPEPLLGPFDAFLAVVGSLERAKAALTQAVPSTRHAGRPLAEALLEFEEGLREAGHDMAAWRTPEVEAEWQACGSALEKALAMAERLRLEAPDPAGFEGLIGAIGDLLEPLGALEQAADRFRDLRV
jgi:hypothetical protein